jgi:cell division septal protein FtsQ
MGHPGGRAAMDKRVRERRRLVSRERGRRRAGLIFVCVLAVVAVALLLWLRSSAVFAVERVSVPVTHHVTQEQVAAAVSPARGVSLLKLSTGSIEKNLKALPYLRSIHVYRQFPNSLQIRLEEYEPVARLRTADGKGWLVADDGRLLEKVGLQGASPLPLIVAAGQFAAQEGGTVPQAVVAALPVVLMLQKPEVGATLPAVEQISVSAGGEVVVQFQGGIRLRLGVPSDLEQKMMVASAIIQQHLRDGKSLEYVDASAPDRLAVKAH